VKWKIIPAIVVALLIASLVLFVSSSENGQTKLLANFDGKDLYLQNCASCHGANLKGQPNWRRRKPDGRLPAPPHDETGHTWHHPDQLLFEITKRGTEAIVGGDYKSDMPGFGGILSDDEIKAVLAFIKSQWPGNIRKRQQKMSNRTSETSQ